MYVYLMHECIQKKGHVVIENLLVSFRAHKAYPTKPLLSNLCMYYVLHYVLLDLFNTQNVLEYRSILHTFMF